MEEKDKNDVSEVIVEGVLKFAGPGRKGAVVEMNKRIVALGLSSGFQIPKDWNLKRIEVRVKRLE